MEQGPIFSTMKTISHTSISKNDVIVNCMDSKMVETKLFFKLHLLFESMSLFLTSVEYNLSKHHPLPKINESMIIPEPKLKKANYENGILSQSHNSKISLWLFYNKARSEFCFALNIKNEFSSSVLLSFEQIKELLGHLFHPYMTTKCNSLNTIIRTDLKIANHRHFWMDTLNDCITLRHTKNILEWLYQIRDIFTAINSSSPYSKCENLELYKKLKSLKRFTSDFNLFVFLICSSYVHGFSKQHSESFLQQFTDLLKHYDIIEDCNFDSLFA